MVNVLSPSEALDRAIIDTNGILLGHKHAVALIEAEIRNVQRLQHGRSFQIPASLKIAADQKVALYHKDLDRRRRQYVAAKDVLPRLIELRHSLRGLPVRYRWSHIESGLKHISTDYPSANLDFVVMGINEWKEAQLTSKAIAEDIEHELH